MIRALLLAIQFLTRIPVPTLNDISERDISRSQYFYPLVGLLIGSILLACSELISLDTSLEAALLLSLWVLLTGALHIDGLADCADAWVGGYGDKEKTLRIMKDPQSGPIAVTLVVCTLLIKFTAIQLILDQGLWIALILTPLISRSLLPLLFHTTPYLRSKGLGSALINHQSHWLHLLSHATVMALIFALMGIESFIILFVALCVFIIIRQISMKRINGITGDVAGALVEVSEVVVLIAFLSL